MKSTSVAPALLTASLIAGCSTAIEWTVETLGSFMLTVIESRQAQPRRPGASGTDAQIRVPRPTSRTVVSKV